MNAKIYKLCYNSFANVNTSAKGKYFVFFNYRENVACVSGLILKVLN